jgi:hypothetical protein
MVMATHVIGILKTGEIGREVPGRLAFRAETLMKHEAINSKLFLYQCMISGASFPVIT